MKEVYYVQFKKVGKKYYFDKNDFVFNIDDYVVVETSRGLEIGQIASDIIKLTDTEIIKTLKPILRSANNKDLNDYLENQKLAEENYKITVELIKNRNLEMKLVGIDYTLDRTKMCFNYTAEERIDFRELLKDLAQKFKSRIELKQIGFRDGARIVGGVGICGRELCCSKHLTDFDSVSIKMAKNQELSLNPAKITGVCSKLLCCIKYEDDLYTELKKGLVKVGEFVDTPNEKNVKITSVNVLKGTVTVLVTNSNKTYSVTEVVKTKKVEKVNNDRSNK